MKTILVVYSHQSLTKREHQTLKRYAFNTAQPVKEGDRLKIALYDTPVQVVEVFPKALKYVHLSTGVLSNKRITSTQQVEIREIEIGTAETIRATRLDD